MAGRGRSSTAARARPLVADDLVRAGRVGVWRDPAVGHVSALLDRPADGQTPLGFAVVGTPGDARPELPVHREQFEHNRCGPAPTARLQVDLEAVTRGECLFGRGEEIVKFFQREDAMFPP